MNSEDEYRDWVSTLVEREVALDSALTFGKLMLRLPSIPPSIVKDALERRHSISNGAKCLLRQSMEKISGNDGVQVEKSSSPPPHPLDYDWRFDIPSRKYILDLFEKVDDKDTIAMLGTPSIAEEAINSGSPHFSVLLDANCEFIKRFSESDRFRPFLCRIGMDAIPAVSATLTIADPPWYLDSIKLFIWAASRITSKLGRVIVSLPPKGTRPGIDDERKELLNWAEDNGLQFSEVRESAVSYEMPPFERAAFAAAGIFQIPVNWRRGDLFVFTKFRETTVLMPAEENHLAIWDEVVVRGIHFRIRPQHHYDFSDPTLNSIVQEDVLPSVSRRDRRRLDVDVWTTLNRVFRCAGRAILSDILRSIDTNESTIERIESNLRRRLKVEETMQVEYTKAKLLTLIDRERKDLNLS